LLYFTAMFLAVGLTSGISQGVMFLFIDGYLGLGKQLAGLLLLAAPVTLIGIPIWNVVCQRIERQKVWAVCLALVSIADVGFSFVPTGQAGLMPMAALWMTMMLFLTSTFVVAPAMIGDVVDFGRWKFDRDHSGVYIAFYSVVSKSMNALGVAFGFIILDWLGYKAGAATQSADGVFAIKVTAAWIPAAGIALAVPFVWHFPLTRARHSQLLTDIGSRHPLAQATEGHPRA
jgi:GPH family glycoside/pentoside/hexuronide:cation symporter